MLWKANSALICIKRDKSVNQKRDPRREISKTYTLSKGLTLFDGQRVRLCNNRNDIDNFRKLLEDHDINRFETEKERG